MTPSPRQGREARNRAAVAAAATIAVVAAILIAAPSAFAIGLTNLSSAPTNTQAGANSDFTIHMEFTSPGDQVRDLVIGLPPGQIGDPTATPLCTVAQLNADACPANTIVGEVTAVANILGIPLPVTATGFLYNLEAQPGEPARFGIVLHPLGIGIVPPITLQSAVALRPDDFGLNTIIDDIPNTTLIGGDTSIVSQDITLYGIAPGTGRPFSRNPTSCQQATTTFSATSYSGPTTVTPATGQASYTPTGCGALPFSPVFSADVDVPGELEPGTKPAVTTVIRQTAAESGMRNAKVFVPPELGADVNQILPGEVCAPAQFQAHSCPANTRVGTAIAASPVMANPLTGSVYVVDNPGNTAQIGLDLQGQLSLQLLGQLEPSDNSSTFTNLPDIPISRFELRFDGGPDGLLSATRDICRPPAPVFRTDFLAYSGARRIGATDAVVKGCGPLRDPTLRVRLKRTGSEHPGLIAKVKAASGFERLRRVKLKLPPGLSSAGGRHEADISARANGDRLKPSAVRANGRTVTLKLPSYGVASAKLKVAGDALNRRGSLGGRPKFRAKVTDTDGKATSLRVRAKR